MKTIYNRIFMLAVALMMSLAVSAVRMYNKTVEVNGIWYYTYLDENTPPYAWTVYQDSYIYGEYTGDITIPSSITIEVDYTWENDDKYKYKEVKFPVMYINSGTFRNYDKITSVKLPNSVIGIQGESFWGCGLSSVTIPCTAVNIEAKAFQRCTNLSSVTNLSCVPQNINYWLDGVFEIYGDLHVLKGRKKAYQDAPVWNKFNIIDDVEITPTMVKETIDAIGNFINTRGKYEFDQVKFLITNARIAYDSLSKEQQAQVKNIDFLIETEKTYGMSVSTGITDINSDNSKKDGKYIENGKIIIVKNGKKCNISGLKE